MEQFDEFIISRAQKVLDIVLAHFFSNIPGTHYFYTDQKKIEEIRMIHPQEYDLAMEFLPNPN